MRLRGTSIGMQRMTLPPRVTVLVPKRTSSPLRIPSQAMILFADHSCPRLLRGGFSTKHQPRPSPRDVFDWRFVRRDRSSVGITSSNGELDPRSPNGAFFRESMPYPPPPTAAILQRWGIRDVATPS